MRIVSLDTTTAFGSIALLENGELMEEIPMHSSEGFSQSLFGDLQRLLSRHNWKVESVACFSATAGPGSFTGVRVGLTAIKGLAEATGARAAGVSNLQALAACGSGALRAVIADARRGEVYGATYDSDLRVVCPEAVMPFQDWMRDLSPEVCTVIAQDFGPFRVAFRADIPVVEQRLLAAAAGRIAHSRMVAGDIPDTAAIDANYVRRADAELNWKDERVAGTP